MRFAKTHKLSTLAVAIAIALAAPFAWGQGQGSGGGGGGGGGGAGGGKPPGGETAVNNLSYPAVKIDGDSAPYSFAPSALELGVNYSYGCNVPETIGESTYVNTSCVSSDGLIYYTPEQCAAVVPNCSGQAIERIYWQKTAHKWSAVATEHKVIDLGARLANYVDWGDSLESQIWWDTATIRVETTPYADLTIPQTGLTMWHVYGKGTTELWGARASSSGDPDDQPSNYAILHTGAARLNISKISGPVVDCASSVNTGGGIWNPSTNTWSASVYTLYNGAYTAELNIQGKYVYGYNWALRRDFVPAEYTKTGWWRLTFYTDGDVISFNSTTAITPPPPPIPPVVAVAAESETTQFTPVVDVADSLSYIDICVRGSKGGGGIKGGGKPTK